ncbi:MAG: SRPBCC domain-containing protein [Candidatus Gracilibacteria bacterium]|nr:SRPBCC domain-containing protein [Candidatus Gracilibacteria bacterium]
MTKITISIEVNKNIDKAWEVWNNPEHIVNWCFAGDDWSCPKASNDLNTGGKFSTTMAARDGSMSFDLEGVYTNIIDKKNIDYTIIDMQYGENYIEKGRKVSLIFESIGDKTIITETFDAEDIHSLELQKAGWQSILDRFKNYSESL